MTWGYINLAKLDLESSEFPLLCGPRIVLATRGDCVRFGGRYECKSYDALSSLGARHSGDGIEHMQCCKPADSLF